jgi:hypothetical protein
VQRRAEGDERARGRMEVLVANMMFVRRKPLTCAATLNMSGRGHSHG